MRMIYFAAAAIAAAAFAAPAAAQTLKVGVSALPPAQGNPYQGASGSHWWTWTAMYDALTAVDEKGDVQPALAQGWKINTPTEWRFELRPNLKFDNGEPVDAAGIAWVINFLRKDPAGQATSASRTIDLVTGAEALSPTTVAVTTSRPDVILPSKISAIFMVAPKLWQEVGPGGYAAKPSGTGAFKVVAWQPERVQFVARTDSWRKAKVPGMETISLEERTARVQALISNQIHMAPELSIDNVAQIEQAGHRVDMVPASGTLALQYIVAGRDTPFKDIRVRQALNLAVDKESIVRNIYAGRATISAQGASPNTFGFDRSIKPYPHDPARAKQLLTEAGYPNGFNFVAEVQVGQTAGDTDTMQAMAADLGKVGIKVDLRPVTTADWVKKFGDTSWEGPVFGMRYQSAPTLDANRFFGFNSCRKPKPYFCDEAIMDVVNRADSEFDVEKRRKLLQEGLRYYHDQAHGLYLVDLIEITGVHRTLQGFKNLIKTFDYDNMSIASR